MNAIDFDALDPATQAAVLQRTGGVRPGPGSPLLTLSREQIAPPKPKDASRAAQKRSGNEFEAELEAGHAVYLMQGAAWVTRTHPETVVSGVDERGPVLRYKKGGARPDFLGFYNASTHVGGIAGTMPVAFDAKNCGDVEYAHPAEQRHQLLELRDVWKCGGRGFLLVRDTTRAYAYVVESPSVLGRLYAGEAIALRTPGRNAQPLFPVVIHASAGEPIRWDWRALLLRLPRPTQ